MHALRDPRYLAVVVTALLIQSSLQAEQQFAVACPQAESVVPDPVVRKVIEKNEQNSLKCVLAGYEPGLKKMLADAMSDVHENGQVSNKQEFFRDYLSQGYIDARLEPKEET